MNLNLQKVSKAIAGSVIGGLGAGATSLVVVPESANMPWWGYIAVGVINAGLVFAGVYAAPRNSQ